jgi:predicted transcriptional regulator
MKTITLKADKAFDAVLSELAEQQHMTRSAVIREAVVRYHEWLEYEQLRQQIYTASLKTRKHHETLMRSMDQANNDGL